MKDNQGIVDLITDRILFYIKKAIAKAPFDQTFRAQITENVGNGKYKILYKGTNYTARGKQGLSVGNWVYVCAPQNNWSELFIHD